MDGRERVRRWPEFKARSRSCREALHLARRPLFVSDEECSPRWSLVVVAHRCFDGKRETLFSAESFGGERGSACRFTGEKAAELFLKATKNADPGLRTLPPDLTGIGWGLAARRNVKVPCATAQGLCRA
ncbi:hypothetical protein MTO96_013198 [Rhipicephalus appendiculatus]